MGSRWYPRRSNGRFRRATLEDMLGLSAPSCPACNRLNPYTADEEPPRTCHACGSPMTPPAASPAAAATPAAGQDPPGGGCGNRNDGPGTGDDRRASDPDDRQPGSSHSA